MNKAKNTILISLIIIFFGYGFHAFATDGSTVEQNLAEKMDTFVKILSWIWIPITNLAGKFMTNSLVTGEILKIADFLFQGWSLARTIVNFVIVGVILTIIWDVITKGGTKGLGTKIVKLIITTLAVNLSRFALSAMVDLWTLALLGVSNMGSSIIDSLPVKKSLLEQMACPPKEIIIDFEWKSNIITPSCTSNGTDGLSIEDIVPTTDNMSWPLRYFWIGVFHIFDFLSSNGDSHELKSVTIWLLVKLFLMIMFITPIIALLVVNFARIFMIWMRFLFAPFIALRRGMEGAGIGRLDALRGKVRGRGDDYFDIKNIIWAIFAPAMVAATLFLAVITIASLFGALTKGVNDQTSVESLCGAASEFWNDVDGGVISVDNESITIPGGGKMTFDGNVYEDTSKQIMGSFGYLIICVMTMGLLWAVFRVGLSTSSLLSSYGQKVMDAGKKTITTGIKLPLGVDGKNISLDQLGDKFGFNKVEGIARGNMITQTQRSQFDIAEQTKGNILGKLWYDYDINRWGTAPFKEKDFGIKEADLNPNLVDKTKVATFEAESQKFFKGIMDNMISRKTTIKWDSSQWRNALSSWITAGGYDYMVSKKIIKKDDDKTKHFVEGEDGKKTFSIDKFWADTDANQAAGGFMKKIFSKEFYSATNKSPATIFADYTKDVKGAPMGAKFKIKYSDLTG